MKNTQFSRVLSCLPKYIAFTMGILIIVFLNTQKVFSSMASDLNMNDQPIIEHLRLHVDNHNRQAWLNAEKGSWEQWLITKKGFLGRKLFWDPLREEATVMITWSSFSQWKDIPQGEIDAVQERFEQLAREGTGKETGNPFPLTYEGELLPQ